MLKLANGAVPVELAGKPNTGIVLARWNGEYVVWRYYVDAAAGVAHCEHGNYFPQSADGLGKAYECFAKRVKAFYGW